jgi:two-component system sensor histidine kinase UhpB
MRRRSLLAQVLGVNLLLIAATVLVATIAVDLHVGDFTNGRQLAVLALALIATFLGNALLLRRRFAPLDQMISTMERADLSVSAGRVPVEGADSVEVQRLGTTLNRMLGRLEIERREAGRAAVRAQERERQRIAQDLHDEVNQALTAVLLRLEATSQSAPPELQRELGETKRLATQAMQELLNIARQLRPTVLDDHGLIPALQTQVRDFAEQTRIRAEFHHRGPVPRLTPEQQLSLYRVTQEGLSNIAQHAEASRVEVELSFVGRTVLRISDDGRGFAGGRDGGLGLSGMRERALLAGGTLDIYSAGPGRGTRVELKIG